MSAIETLAKPHVVALMDDQNVVLGGKARADLATWIALIVLLFDVVESASMAIHSRIANTL